MGNELPEGRADYLEELRLQYRDLERSKALHMELCELIVDGPQSRPHEPDSNGD